MNMYGEEYIFYTSCQPFYIRLYKDRKMDNAYYMSPNVNIRALVRLLTAELTPPPQFPSANHSAV